MEELDIDKGAGICVVTVVEVNTVMSLQDM